MICARFIMPNVCYMRFYINENTCSGCGTCLDVCPTEAIKMQGNHAVITVECIDCGACPRVCPEGAIRMAQSAVVQNSR
ncbi:MAG TPA: 4Fe-4S binding protein [Nitrospirota bacterium]